MEVIHASTGHHFVLGQGLESETSFLGSSRVLQRALSPLRQTNTIATETTRTDYRLILRPRAVNTVVTDCSNHFGGGSVRSSLKGPNESSKKVGVHMRGILTSKHHTRIAT